jgi:hypothetical protein
MKKILLVLLGTTLLSLSAQAQGVTITEKKVEEVIEKLEKTPVEVIEVKTMKKWKALGLSTDMKDKMDYPVVRVKYKTDKLLKTMVIDVNLVPIDYDYAILEPK